MFENKPLETPLSLTLQNPARLKSLVDECKTSFHLRSDSSHFFGSIISYIGISMAKLVWFESCR